jgi:hypothetical protein
LIPSEPLHAYIGLVYGVATRSLIHTIVGGVVYKRERTVIYPWHSGSVIFGVYFSEIESTFRSHVRNLHALARLLVPSAAQAAQALRSVESRRHLIRAGIATRPHQLQSSGMNFGGHNYKLLFQPLSRRN